MLVTYNSLKKYVDFSKSPQEIATLLTSIGFEVESVVEVNRASEGLEIALIKKISPHPNADKLKLVTIETKHDEYKVVCGASNTKKGAYVVFASENTILPNGLKIKKAVIRGTTSCGMLCSKQELDIDDDNEGIWLLENASLQKNLQEYFGEIDTVLDIDVPSNRPDCLSTLGIAQEIASYLDEHLYLETGKKIDIKPNISVSIEPTAPCSRYISVSMQNIKVEPSPLWLKQRLKHLGQKSINNIVDVTNYMLCEYGQPMHAFDLDTIKDKTIKIRFASEKETINVLGNKIIKLSPEDLVVADAEKPLALAGVIGGVESGVSTKTSSIFLECAIFDPICVREIANRHQIKTASSIKFSKWVNPENPLFVLHKAVELIKEISGGDFCALMCDLQNHKQTEKKKILFSFEDIQKKLGISLEETETISLLKKLSITLLNKNNHQVELEIPTHRTDLNHSWDILEEIARLFGYDKISPTLAALQNANLSIGTEKIKDVSFMMRGLGYHQVMHLSFLEKKFVEKHLGNNPLLHNLVTIKNPISIEQNFLRNQLLFGFLKTLRLNHEKKNDLFNKFYECGNVFSQQEDGTYLEEKMLGFLGHKDIESPNWTTPKRGFDFQDLNGDLQEIFQNFGINSNDFEIRKEAHWFFSNGISGSVFVKNMWVGVLGKLSKKILNDCKMEKASVFYAEIFIDRLLTFCKKSYKHQPTSIYPSIFRDFAVVVEKHLPINNIQKIIEKSHSLVKDVNLTNIYTGNKIADNKASVVFNIEVGSFEKTLSKEEADAVVEDVKNALIKEKIDFNLR